MRPFAWGDSFGFRHVITRSRDVTEPGQLAGLKIRTIQSPIYVKAVELMGASPTPMAFGEVYTSMQTGVIDGYEHDASTTLQQRFYEVAHYMARTGHIAGVLGLWASTAGLARLPADLRATLERAALDAARHQRAMGAQEDASATAQLAANGMTIREIDGRAFRPVAERLWNTEGARAGRGLLARDDPRMTTAIRRSIPIPESFQIPRCPRPSRTRLLQWSIAILVVAQAAVVGSAGRRPPRHAPADSLDRGDRPPAAGLADVRRRDLGAAARSASARHRVGPPAVAGPPRGGRPRAAARADGVFSVPGRARLAAHGRERG